MNDIEQFTDSIIHGCGGLLAFEDHEFSVTSVDRDVAVVRWTLRCLANPRNELSQAVLDAIMAQRKKVLEG